MQLQNYKIMPIHGNRYYHHYTELPEICAICGNHIKTYWKDKEQLNGFSDTTSKYNKEVVHYFCIPGAKTLQEINEERKILKHKR